MFNSQISSKELQYPHSRENSVTVETDISAKELSSDCPIP